uniref:Endonuclease/exonuclease/phosphatase domain-containing protein n=1 Tax=Magallana gigas TaxID=29159 RepID=K1PA87_MAGGI
MIGSALGWLILFWGVWLARDADMISSGNVLTYPFSFSASHGQGETLIDSLPPCANVSLAGVMFKILANGCTRKNTSDEQAQCVLEKTGVMNLPQICISCLAISATGGFSPNRILKDCVLTSQGEVNLPGLLVLSKRPLINPVVKYFLPFTRTTVRRGYIHFQDEEVGDISCTHLTPDLGPTYVEPNLSGIFSNYAEQQLYEIITMVTDLSSASRVVIMGDLNCGPSLPGRNIQEEFETSYYHFIMSGYNNPYIKKVGLCTYCRGNPLTLAQNELTSSPPENTILDHILVRGIHVSFTQRVFTENVPGLLIPPSDHYGVQSTVVNKNSNFQVAVDFNVTFIRFNAMARMDYSIQIDPIHADLNQGCLNEGSEILTLQCLYEKAGYFDMSRSCISCVSLTGFDYGTLLKNCFVKKTRSNLPGLLVLSKRKLIGPKNLVEKYGSWEKQNLDETKKLANSFPNNGGRAIIMGDLNAGPFTPIQGDEGYHMDSYKYYLDQGFLPSLDSECTYCIENPLSIDDVNSIIDHILVRPPANENKKYSAERVFRNSIPGEKFPPSDHYGVLLNIEEQ